MAHRIPTNTSTSTSTAGPGGARSTDDAGGEAVARFGFDVDPRWCRWLGLIGVTEERAEVLIEPDGALIVRYGPWLLRTTVENVASTERSGGYSWWKVIGPHLSMADRGVTFGTNDRDGLCITFHEPVPGLLPFASLRHPGVTVTVADPDGLAERLRTGRAGG